MIGTMMFIRGDRIMCPNCGSEWGVAWTMTTAGSEFDIDIWDGEFVRGLGLNCNICLEGLWDFDKNMPMSIIRDKKNIGSLYLNEY
jgi:hypothetical protein